MWQRAHVSEATALTSLYAFPDYFWVDPARLRELTTSIGEIVPVIETNCTDAVTGQRLVVRLVVVELEDVYAPEVNHWRLPRWESAVAV
jgi:hypothetical protein